MTDASAAPCPRTSKGCCSPASRRTRPDARQAPSPCHGGLSSCQAFGEWNDEAARRWWSERALALRERCALSPEASGAVSGEGLTAGTLLSIDIEACSP